MNKGFTADFDFTAIKCLKSSKSNFGSIDFQIKSQMGQVFRAIRIYFVFINYWLRWRNRTIKGVQIICKNIFVKILFCYTTGTISWKQPGKKEIIRNGSGSMKYHYKIEFNWWFSGEKLGSFIEAGKGILYSFNIG